MARMVTVAEYQGILSRLPPEKGGREVTLNWIRELCRRGLLKGAVRDDFGRREWRIPNTAKPPSDHLELRGVRSEDAVSPSAWAKEVGVSRSMVYYWLRRGEVEGAKRTEHGWFIPKGAPDPRKGRAAA